MTDSADKESMIVRNARLAVEAELRKKHVLNQPVAKFDVETKTIYLQHSDGTVSHVSNVPIRRSYGEKM